MNATLHRLLGLLDPDAASPVGPGPGPARRQRGARGVRLVDEVRRGRVAGGAPVEEVVRCDYDGAELDGPVLVGTAALTRLAGARLRQPEAAPEAVITGCLADEATLIAPRLPGARACALRWGRVEGGALGRLELCDLVGTRLVGVRLEAALGCDLTAARLTGCDLSGADLRGARFVRAVLEGTRLEGARVEGADFSGARGLSDAQVEALLAGGARLGWGEAPLARLWPAIPATRRHRLARGLRRGLVGLGLATALAAVALVITPPAPPEAPPPPEPLARTLSPEDKRRARMSLEELRAALSRAHARMVAEGAVTAAWPGADDLAENRFDLDGEGPGEVFEALVPGGLPDNPLTEPRGGVRLYCEPQPDPAALMDAEADWIYCDLSGRVFASAGASGEPTLNW